MGVLDATTLDSLRATVSAVASDVFPDVMDVQRGTTLTRDVTSPESFTVNANLVHNNIPCKYRQLRADEKFTFQRVDTTSDYAVKCPAEKQILEADILKIEAKGIKPAFDIQVTGIQEKSNGVFQTVFGKRL